MNISTCILNYSFISNRIKTEIISDSRDEISLHRERILKIPLVRYQTKKIEGKSATN